MCHQFDQIGLNVFLVLYHNNGTTQNTLIEPVRMDRSDFYKNGFSPMMIFFKIIIKIE